MDEQERKHQLPTILRVFFLYINIFLWYFCTSINFKLPPPSLMVICSCRFGYFGLLTRSFSWRCEAWRFKWINSTISLNQRKNDVAIFSINNNKRAEFTRNRVYQQKSMRSKADTQTHSHNYTAKDREQTINNNVDTDRNPAIQNAYVQLQLQL